MVNRQYPTCTQGSNASCFVIAISYIFCINPIHLPIFLKVTAVGIEYMFDYTSAINENLKDIRRYMYQDAQSYFTARTMCIIL